MKKVEKAWMEIDIYTAAQSMKNFSTGVLASHWLEMVKTRLYDGDESAAWTLHRMFRDLMDGFSPICPFFCHYLSSTLYDRSAVIADSFPSIPLDFETYKWTEITESVMDFNSEVWRTKKEQGLSLNSELSGVNIPDNLSQLEVPLRRMHKLLD
jgi:valyl-tRNA synthetase